MYEPAIASRRMATSFFKLAALKLGWTKMRVMKNSCGGSGWVTPAAFHSPIRTRNDVGTFLHSKIILIFWWNDVDIANVWNDVDNANVKSYVKLTTLCATVNTFSGSINAPEPWNTSPGPSKTACHGYAPYGACPAPGLGLPCTGGYRMPHWYGPLKQHRCKPGRHVDGEATVGGTAYKIKMQR